MDTSSYRLLRRCLGAAIAPALLGLIVPGAMAAQPVVRVENQTRATQCAEEDNVSLSLAGTGVAGFRVQALQPTYLDTITRDVTAPDFSGCNFDGSAHPTDPRHSFKPRTVVLHEGQRWRIVGMTLPTFWRPQRVPVSIGGRTDREGFHMIQLYAKASPGAKPLEALVMYPSDGYWRIKPLPLPRFGDGVYGSSFVMGPVAQDGRPVANIVAMAVDLKPLAFRLRFSDGSRATVRVDEVSRRRTALDVRFDRPIGSQQPFAVLRSMYVTPDNADMSEVRWQASPTSAAQASPLPEVSVLEAAQVRFGRSVPSRHNTSAPDIEFSRFRAGR